MQDLDAIMADRPQDPPANEQPEQRNEGRDELGRFAPKSPPEQQAQPEQQQQAPAPQGQEQQERQAPPPGYIPQQAFDARMAKTEEKWSEKVSNLEGQLQAALRQIATFQQGQQPKQEA